MVIYEVTASGPEEYQVTAIDSGRDRALVGDFHTLAEAESFAAHMRQIDADVSHPRRLVR
jgi:hypothetical protein